MAAPSIISVSKIRSTTGNSLTAAITAPSAGNLMVAHVTSYAGTGGSATASDSVNGAYTVGSRHDTGADQQVGSFYFPNCATSGSVNGTVGGGAGGSGIVGIFHEVSGAATASPLTGTPTGSAELGTNPDSQALTTTDADAILFAAVAWGTNVFQWLWALAMWLFSGAWRGGSEV